MKRLMIFCILATVVVVIIATGISILIQGIENYIQTAITSTIIFVIAILSAIESGAGFKPDNVTIWNPTDSRVAAVILSSLYFILFATGMASAGYIRSAVAFYAIVATTAFTATFAIAIVADVEESNKKKAKIYTAISIVLNSAIVYFIPIIF